MYGGGTEPTTGVGEVGTNDEFLGREEANRRKAGILCMAVVQEVLLFGSETWAMTPRPEKSLEGFHLREVRRMAGMGPKRQRDGTCVYPPIGAALATVVLDEIGVYIARCHKMVAQYIATRPIMD